MKRWLLLVALLSSASCASAANERALKSLAHWRALAAYSRPYRGTPLLAGANRRRGLGEPPLSLRESTRREIKAARDEREGHRYVWALDH